LSEASPAAVIVVAAGGSRRMEGIDKLLAPVGGRPLLAWTLDALAGSPVVARIVVVVSKASVTSIRGASWLPAKVSQVVVGGDRRQQSVAAGMDVLRTSLDDEGANGWRDRVILVHDGARPFVSAALIESVARAAHVHGAAIAVLPVAETIKRLHGHEIQETIDRSTLATAQTPQGVRASLLLRAYERFPPDGPETWTDEAALLEACRIPVHAVPGDPSNFKVTVPADLDRVRASIGSAVTRPQPVRSGIGLDRHPFGPGTPLVLGGIEFPGVPRLFGHSDGDVALHAIADALLGAAGLGDLGGLFPATAQTPNGVDSRRLLESVVGRVRDSGYRPASVDLTIVAARPPLHHRLPAMTEAIGLALGLTADAVNVKASTGNLAGMDGAGRGISAHAIATLVPAG
jgi:2-C-methyl-D-erythritol 4-phosphate cytidylyltransferase/2-C-methyl-D-erythritol 2,4-cyclodiphosphate synthase